MSTEIKDHYELLDCEHQNNLLLEYPDKHKNTPGICPKGCANVKVIKTVKVDVQMAGIEAALEP